MAARRRLDKELVRRKLALDESEAADLISSGRVIVGGSIADKPTRQVQTGDSITVGSGDKRWVSRGAHKLLGAVEAFDVSLANKTVLDAGSSTGGFTEVALDSGASKVFAVDVGYGQLDQKLRTDDRVEVMERVNIRSVTPEVLGGEVDFLVGDMSFVSLVPLAAGLVELVKPGGDIIVLIKPQFEASSEEVSRGKGIITDPQIWERATGDVIDAFGKANSAMIEVMESPIRGTSGNMEFLAWFKRSSTTSSGDQ